MVLLFYFIIGSEAYRKAWGWCADDRRRSANQDRLGLWGG